jgi:chromosomal replication initiation ATPase DnaA
MTLHSGVRTRIDQIESLYGVGLSDMKNGGSFRRFCDARQHFWWLLNKHDGFSLQRTARVTGHHHTTVLYGIRQYQARLETHPERSAA